MLVISRILIVGALASDARSGGWEGVTMLRSSAKRPPHTSAYAALAIGLSLIVYAPILKNYFWMDDFLMLDLLTNWPLGKFLTTPIAGHLEFVRNAFYAGMHAVVGAHPMPYYFVILALHGINVGLVFAIIHTVTGSAPLACLAAAHWGTCPVDEGALGWIAASGHVMVATTTLVVLHGAVRAVWRQTRVGRARSALWAGLLLAGAQSSGNGLVVAIAGPVVLAWLAWGRLTRAARAVLLGVPVVTGWMYGAHYGQLTGPLASSALAKAGMLVHLQAIGLTTLIRGLGYEPSAADFFAPIVSERSVLPTLSWSVWSVAALLVCVWAFAAVWLSTGRTQRLLITVAVLALCNYAAIAAARAYFIELFHQSVVLWTAQTRYHYTATVFLAIGLAVVLATVLGKRLAGWGHAALIVWLTVFAILYAQSSWTIRHYDAERERAQRILTRIDAEISATPAGEPVVTYNEPFLDGPHIYGAASLYVMNRHNGDREVYFVDPRAATVYGERPGSPLARVLLPPPTMRLACGPRFTLQSGGNEGG